MVGITLMCYPICVYQHEQWNGGFATFSTSYFLKCGNQSTSQAFRFELAYQSCGIVLSVLRVIQKTFLTFLGYRHGVGLENKLGN